MRPSSALTASVIVPSYRGEDRLPRLLSAFARQDVPRDRFEVLVVIDGCVDRSAEIVTYASEHGLPVRAIVLRTNQGRVAALNAGFTEAAGDVLIRCDDDLAPGPAFVSSHLARHTVAGAPIGVVGLTRDELARSPYARAYGESRSRLALAASYTGTHPAWQHWAANCSLRRETWLEVGPYDVAYHHYGWEDVDYGYRLHEAGVQVIIAPELETVHYGAADSTVARTLRAYHSGAARRTFDCLHPSALQPPTAGGSLWGHMVSFTTRLGSESHFQTLARNIDCLLPALPLPLAEKLVALSVESAVLAGYGHADAVSARF
ncbi:MAG: glycosyltransferase [Actinomyces urogenitalis]|uniref:glycosyltransferase family 2 protein n=1 Tax=Actinomyces urogenitalis TaxID=103621 RepID=UPI002A83F3EB|nr:glycosyltransferase [Actinomyces urogenitalis]MDY3677862.1 glycosyltransferase [Actinomyces urogenitalis]